MATYYNPKIFNDNLFIYLDAANAKSYSGGTAWKDLSGKGRDTTLVSSPPHSTTNGGYFDFDGTDDYVNANTALPDSFFQGNSTISFWIYFNTVDSDSQGQAVLHHGSNSTYNGFHIMQRNSEVGLALWGTSVYSSTTLSASTWYNLTITHNNTTNDAKVYLNGSLDASDTLASSYVGSGNNCRIAGPIIEGGVYHDELHARIAQVLCYERVLTAADVSQNFNALRSRFGV